MNSESKSSVDYYNKIVFIYKDTIAILAIHNKNNLIKIFIINRTITI